MNRQTVAKPIKRSNLRLFLGKQYFTLRRHMLFLKSGTKYSKQSVSSLPYVCFTHETPLLRNLKDLDMYLQYNKITNLKIAVKKVSGVYEKDHIMQLEF